MNKRIGVALANAQFFAKLLAARLQSLGRGAGSRIARLPLFTTSFWSTFLGGSHMAMKRCESGHYFDSARNASCPLCSGAVVIPPGTPTDAPRPGNNLGSNPQIGSQTVAMMVKSQGIDPVVGWLVCVGGPDRGRDFRVRAEKNFIGRSPQMDIALQGDETISRENHLSLSYNPKKKSFKLIPGEARGIVYVNGEELVGPIDLQRGDRVTLGRTDLLFVPLCGDLFDWGDETQESEKRGKKSAG